MKHMVLLALVAALGGCAHTQTIPEEVKIPIYVPCKVETPALPDYTFHTLTPDDTIWSKVQALLSDRQLAIAYEAELRAALAACKNAPVDNPS